MEQTGLVAPAAVMDAAADEIAGLGAVDTLDRLSANRRRREAAEVDDLLCAIHWAALHGELDTVAGSRALPGAERLVPLGGDGTPPVAEFASAELGAEIGVSPYSASLLVGDALDLAHRLPILWARVRAGEVRPYLGRKVAQATRSASAKAAAAVDAQVAPWADRLTWARPEPIVMSAVIAADPAEAEKAVERAEADEGVWLSEKTQDGLRTIFIRTDAASAIEFDDAVGEVAAELAALGDTDSRTVRRAKAVGVLAHPQQALDLMGEGAGAGPQSRPSLGRQSATLYLHLSAEALETGQGVARAEGVGPITVGQAQRWLRHRNVVIKPVLDPEACAPVDGYEVPDRAREAVHILVPADAFPYASSTSRALDVDHTEPYAAPDDGGPPGQTAIGNLAKLTRRHHRIKTHGRWQVEQPYRGVLIWRSPHGRHFLVDPTGTRRL
jgi:hypothetical protein